MQDLFPAARSLSEVGEEEAADAVINLVCSKLVAQGIYGEVMKECAPDERRDVEEALERHAARQRAKGIAGW